MDTWRWKNEGRKEGPREKVKFGKSILTKINASTTDDFLRLIKR